MTGGSGEWKERRRKKDEENNLFDLVHGKW